MARSVVASVRFPPPDSPDDDQLVDAQARLVVDDPAQRRGAVVETGRERVASVLATAVAELDADHDEARRRELVAQTAVRRAGGLEHHHAAAVQVQHAGQRVGMIGRTVDVERDVVAVEPPDDLDAAFDALDVWHATHERVEQPLEALLGRRHAFEEVLERRRRVDRRGRGRVGRPERLHRRDHPRIGTRVVAQ